MGEVLTEEEQQVAYYILLKADRYHSGHFAEMRNLRIEEILEKFPKK